MGKHVLVPVDGSDPSWKAVDQVPTVSPERITVLHVVDPAQGLYAGAEGYYDQQTFQRAMDRGDELCAEARERLEQHEEIDDLVPEVAVEIGRPGREICRYAKEHDVDHIVIGSHGRAGLSRILLGSVAEGVVRRAHVPVTVVR